MKNIFYYFSLFLDFFSLILAAFFFRFSNGVAGLSFSSGRLTLNRLSFLFPRYSHGHYL